MDVGILGVIALPRQRNRRKGLKAPSSIVLHHLVLGHGIRNTPPCHNLASADSFTVQNLWSILPDKYVCIWLSVGHLQENFPRTNPNRHHHAHLVHYPTHNFLSQHLANSCYPLLSQHALRHFLMAAVSNPSVTDPDNCSSSTSSLPSSKLHLFITSLLPIFLPIFPPARSFQVHRLSLSKPCTNANLLQLVDRSAMLLLAILQDGWANGFSSCAIDRPWILLRPRYSDPASLLTPPYNIHRNEE